MPGGLRHRIRRNPGSCKLESLGLTEKIRIRVLRTDLHVRAVFTIKNKRKTVGGADSKDNQSGEMVRGRAEQGSVDSFELKLISEKDSHVIGSDTGKHRRFETQP